MTINVHPAPHQAPAISDLNHSGLPSGPLGPALLLSNSFHTSRGSFLKGKSVPLLPKSLPATSRCTGHEAPLDSASCAQCCCEPAPPASVQPPARFPSTLQNLGTFQPQMYHKGRNQVCILSTDLAHRRHCYFDLTSDFLPIPSRNYVKARAPHITQHKSIHSFLVWFFLATRKNDCLVKSQNADLPGAGGWGCSLVGVLVSGLETGRTTLVACNGFCFRL